MNTAILNFGNYFDNLQSCFMIMTDREREKKTHIVDIISEIFEKWQIQYL